MDKVPQVGTLQVKSSMEGHLSYLRYQRRNTTYAGILNSKIAVNFTILSNEKDKAIP